MPTDITLNTYAFIGIYIFAAFGLFVFWKIASLAFNFRKIKNKVLNEADPVVRDKLIEDWVKTQFDKPRE